MKTLLLQANPGSKLIALLFVLALTISNLTAQTSVSASANKSALIPTVHYQPKTKAVVASPIKIYSIMTVKNFPIIESGEKYVLNAKDDSEDFNLDELFCSKAVTPAKNLTENTALALNYKTKNHTNS